MARFVAVGLLVAWTVGLAAVAAPSRVLAADPPSIAPDVLDNAGEYTIMERLAIQDLLTGIRDGTGVRVVLDLEARATLMEDADVDAIFDRLAAEPGSPREQVLLILTMTELHCVGWSTLSWGGPTADLAMTASYMDELHDLLHPVGCDAAPPVESALANLQSRLAAASAGTIPPEPTPAAAGGATGGSGGAGGSTTGNGLGRIRTPAILLFLGLLLAGPLAVLVSMFRAGRANLATFRAQQAVNRDRSIALVGALLSVLAVVGFAIALPFVADLGAASIGGISVAVVGLVVVPIALWFGDGMMLGAAGAKPAPASEAELHNVVSEMALSANLPKPRVYIIETAVPNALTTGRNPANASIAVTRGLLERLDREQLQGVIAHEMGHIRNLDVRYAMLVAVLVGTIVLITDLFFRGTLRAITSGQWARVRGKNAVQGAIAMLLFLLVLLLVATILRLFAPLAAIGVQAAVSRQREFLADATAVELGRNPVGLERALESIANVDDRMSDANRGISHAYLVHPTFSDGELEGSNARWRGVFATHPPILERVNRLRHLRGEGPVTGELAMQLAAEA